MEDFYFLAYLIFYGNGNDLETLVAIEAQIGGVAVLLIHYVDGGCDVGGDGLVEVFGEDFAVDVVAEVFGVADEARGGVELPAEAGGDVLAALIDVEVDRVAGGVCGRGVEAAIL